MAKWIIPAMLVQLCELRQSASFIQPRELMEGELALFNKNGLHYQYFSNCKKLMNKYAWVGEAETLDPYFRECIKETC